MSDKVDVRDKRCFISGPMSGLEHYNVTAFAEAHAILREAGAKWIYDPAVDWLVSTGDELGHSEYLRICIHEITRCMGMGRGQYYDYLVQLDGWEKSLGAKTEYEVAKACGIKVVSIKDVRAGV